MSILKQLESGKSIRTQGVESYYQRILEIILREFKLKIVPLEVAILTYM